MSDQAVAQEFLRRLRERRDGALEELVETYTQPLLSGAFALGLRAADAEELVQDTLAAFLSAMDRFEGRSQLRTYLFGILYHKAAALRRKRSRHDSLDEINEDYEKRFDDRGMWSAPPRGPEDSALDAEIRAWIEKCSEGLSPNQRAAFFLGEVEGQSSDEICNSLGVSYTNLRVLLFRARTRLRECLERNWAGKR